MIVNILYYVVLHLCFALPFQVEMYVIWSKFHLFCKWQCILVCYICNILFTLYGLLSHTSIYYHEQRTRSSGVCWISI